MSIRSFIRKNRTLHTIVSGVYRNTIYLVTTGYTKGFAKYFFCVKKDEISKLRQMGFYDIDLFAKRSWKFGSGRDHAFRRYYVAKYNGCYTFIKIAQNDSTISNEIELARYLDSCRLDFVSRLVKYDLNFGNNALLLATEYCEGLRSFEIPKTYESFKRLCKDFLCILELLANYNVVHGDIHLNNLMLKKNGKLVLLDFGISKIQGKQNSVDYIARPGTYYKCIVVNEKEYRIYDDAYSFCCMIKKMGILKEWENAIEYEEIHKRIGTTRFFVRV